MHGPPSGPVKPGWQRQPVASGVPYLVNVMTDVNAMYPRNTTGI